ncbi:uncharacterized protein [Misgurnus anguillicaudatus]
MHSASCQVKVFKCFPWPESTSDNTTRNIPFPVYPSSLASYFLEGCVQPRLTVYVSQLQNRYQSHAKGGADGVYYALYLEDLTVFELAEKMALTAHSSCIQTRANKDLRLGFGCDGAELHRGDQLHNQHFER